MTVGLLTQEQAHLLKNRLFNSDSYFNPVQDIYGRWVISLNEMENCIYAEFDWIKSVPIIEYEPSEVDISF